VEAARALYTLIGTALLPLLPLRLWWRGLREPLYRSAIGERFGRYRTGTFSAPVLWVHSVSVGETRAALPLVQRMKASYPEATILLTHMTASGRAAGRELFGDGVVQVWLPYDVPFAVNRFLAHFRPAAGFLVETELWPNLIGEAQRQDVPVFLVNARMSERSAKSYARFSSLTGPMLRRLRGVAAQSPADATRLAELGATAPIVTGNLKYDVSIPDDALMLGAELRLRFGASRPVWMAASTRDGEEALILDAIARAPMPPGSLLVMVPRHPHRFAVVAELLRSRGVPFVRRSENRSVPADIAVVLGDSMGEMSAYYAATDVAFVGGSLLPLGGQNLIEPIALGIPVLIGPHTFNFAEATAGAIAAGAAQLVADADEMAREVSELLSDPSRRKAMGDAARTFHAAHQGTVQRLWNWLRPQLTGPSFAAHPNPTLPDRD
jgi:3-deoxy-D-manno-octulosonic-acid transferase